MVVDDHHLRLLGAPAHAGDETVGDERTALAQPGFRAGDDLAPDRRVLGNPVELCAIAGLAAPDPVENACGLRVGDKGQLSLVLGQPAQAHVVADALHHRERKRPREHARQPRQIHAGDLILQVARPRRHHHAPAGKNRRHEVRDGLARARTGLDQEALVEIDGPRHALGHGQLSWPRLVPRQGRGQRSAGAQDFGRCLFEEQDYALLKLAGPSSVARPPGVTVRKKHEVAPVWQDGPMASTTYKIASPSQSRRTS